MSHAPAQIDSPATFYASVAADLRSLADRQDETARMYQRLAQGSAETAELYRAIAAEVERGIVRDWQGLRTALHLTTAGLMDQRPSQTLLREAWFGAEASHPAEPPGGVVPPSPAAVPPGGEPRPGSPAEPPPAAPPAPPPGAGP